MQSGPRKEWLCSEGYVRWNGQDGLCIALTGEEPAIKEKARFLGLDVHAQTIAVAIAEPDGAVVFSIFLTFDLR